MTGLSYDAVVVGAGHNGLALATYLARAGLSTVVMEQADTVGGMSRTIDGPQGFRHHHHANALLYQDLIARTPALDVETLGVSTTWPHAQHGLCFADDRPPLILFRIDQLERSCQSIGQFSKRDARMYRRLKRHADRLTPALARAMFGLPHRTLFEALRTDITDAHSGLALSPQLGSRTARAVIDELFESPEMRTMMYLLSCEFGGALDEAGSDLSFLGHVVWLIGRRRLPLRGMSQVPQALHAAFTRAGGHTMLGSPVDRVLVSAAGATAVQLADGRRVNATTVVASGAGIGETYRRFLGDSVLDEPTRQLVSAFEQQRATSLASVNFALREPPRYRAAVHDENINSCFQTFIGLDEPEAVLANQRDVRAGLLPEPAGAVRVNSVWDASQAPGSQQVAGIDCVFPPTAALDQAWLDAVRDSFPTALYETWRGYAPNMTAENIIHPAFELSPHSERKMMFGFGAGQYRSGVERLYLCGCGTYPGGGVHGACAFNAFQVISHDLGIGRPSTEGDDGEPRTPIPSR